MIDIRKLVDVENATQSRRIFGDPEIYQMELERVFARCWLFLTHESLVPNHGDFVVTKMGEDEVIVWRQRDGAIKVYLNVCTHRGMRLCQAESGNAKGFSCNYHGWAFGVEGNLAAVPLDEAIYGPGFDKCKLALREVPLVESYRGFIFACMDPQAPTLNDYLGDSAWYMDIWADVPGGVELLGPPARSIVSANWKSPTENFIGDSYHVGWTHAPALAGLVGEVPPHASFIGDDTCLQMTSRYGHGLGIFNQLGVAVLLHECPELAPWVQRRAGEVAAARGPQAAGMYAGHWDASIFPNCSYLIGDNVFKVWHPLGPDKIEIMTWTIVEKDMPDDLKRRVQVATHRMFGPAGMLESDDLDNFDFATRPNRGFVTRQGDLNLQMGLGQEREDPVLPGVVGPFMSEMAQRGFYRAYADCLASGDWTELEAATAGWKQATLRQ